jgi:MinD superfamily P-loop ATPase
LEIAIASGKGGTGKTTVAVKLALAMVGAGRR